jgi:hypothetical protein
MNSYQTTNVDWRVSSVVETIHRGIIRARDEVVEFLVFLFGDAVLGGKPERTDCVDALAIHVDREPNEVRILLNDICLQIY